MITNEGARGHSPSPWMATVDKKEIGSKHGERYQQQELLAVMDRGQWLYCRKPVLSPEDEQEKSYP